MSNLHIVLITLFCSALFSGLEIAFNSLNRLRLELDLQSNDFTARIINFFRKNQSRFIGALLLGNNISNVIYGIAIAKILNSPLESILPDAVSNDFTILLCQSLISTLIVIFTAEFIPKILFRINPNTIMKVLAIPTLVIFIILFPLVLVYIGISELIIKYILKVKTDSADYRLSIVDFNDYLKEYSNPDDENGDIQEEIQLFQNAIDFHTIKLRECMVPRNEIQAVKQGSSLEDIRRKFDESLHSKIPVYQDTPDNIIGYYHINDFLLDDIDTEKAVRPIEYYAETFPANKLLKKLTQKHQSIAVVVDEFGGTAGMVTTEDLIEEIFGEIEDEYDDEKANPTEKQTADNTFVFSARLEIDYLNETYRLGLPVSDEYETLAGCILHYYESIPHINNVIEIGNYKMKILKVSNSKIEEVEVTRQ